MARWQGPSRRLPSGAKRHLARKKRKRELGRVPIETRVAPRRLKKQRVMGGNIKLKLFSTMEASVTDPQTKKTRKMRILGVERNQASVELNRRSIITKGALIKVEGGVARVTSRPGQHGVVNAVLEK
ncbi:MAG: 30S ribosomal protein S8e [Promethearchaeota archaeon]